MKKIQKIKKKTSNYFYDHIRLSNAVDISKSVFLASLGALFYAFGFYCFVTPHVVNPELLEGSSITTGGIGGISQVITLILGICGVHIDAQFTFLMQSILYFALNIPILIFAYFKIGKRFAIITLVNVGLSSAFIQAFNQVELFKDVARLLQEQHQLIARPLFAGVSIGLASALAFKGDVSCGGIDVISYYFAMRKSTSVGKYTATLNSTIIISYSLLTIINNKGAYVEVAIVNLLFSVIYLFTTTLVVDRINTRNKKTQLQIITENPDISSILIANFPHSTTLVEGKGGYSHTTKIIIYMTVSSNEVKNVVALVKRADSKSFVTVTPLIQAYGNFFIRPIK